MKLKTIFKKLAVLMTILSMATLSAWGHGSTKPQHGGIVEMDGETLFELVVQKNMVVLYVSYDDEAIDSAAYKAKLTIKFEGSKQKVDLTSAGDNKFEAHNVSIAQNAKVTVFIKNTTTMATSGTKFIIE